MAYHPEWIRAYYRSNTWRLRRSRYYKRHPYQCASCGTKTKVALHHVTYAGEWGDLRNQGDWGKEPDQALMPLCMRRWFRQGCHDAGAQIEAPGDELADTNGSLCVSRCQNMVGLDDIGITQRVRAIIDVPGVGGGVVDRLAELDLPVVPYNGGEAPIDKERRPTSSP